ncbi:MAG: hypothetical protein ABI877_19280 [Gemmatimonadaceae bacterium]
MNVAHQFSTRLILTAALVAAAGCASSPPTPAPMPAVDPRNDARVGLKAGLTDAGEAISNLKVLAKAASPPGFLGITNSDLAFSGNYVIQGNYNGPVIWDVSNPSKPELVTAYTCPASQNDISVYKTLMFMSAEANNGRVDCLPGGVADTVSALRFRGVRVFDISDIKKPRLVANVQTCRGSHTHTVVEDPKDPDNIYIYVSGSAGIRSPNELAGCVRETPDKDANSSLLRIEIIKVPVNNPERSAIVSRANIFSGLTVTPSHGASGEDLSNAAKAAAAARASGGFTAVIPASGQEIVLGGQFITVQLDSIVKARGGEGVPTAADTAALRTGLQGLVNKMFGSAPTPGSPIAAGRQCHDITVYPSLGLAGGACEGHGLLIDISDPVNPKRLDAVADSNFAYWHSATFNNDGTKILFSDEWGGGGAPKCRASDKKEWGSDAIFSIVNRKMKFESYYKIPTIQTSEENCVAHNGSLIPIPGRDVMVQAWYQGGISVFDWTDAAHPFEMAYFDRGPVDSTRMAMGGSWSVYWYNGALVSSEIARGLDVAELTPSRFISQNEIDAAKSVHWTHLNAQGQPKIEWPPTFALARAFVDQLERKKCLPANRISEVRQALSNAERAPGGAQRSSQLSALASQLDTDARGSCDAPKVEMLKKAVTDLQAVVS